MPVNFYEHRFLGRSEDLNDFIETVRRQLETGHWRVWLEGDFCGRRFKGWEDSAQVLNWAVIEQEKRRAK